MIDRISIDGVIYAISPTTAPSLGDRVVTVDGVTYVIGEPVVEAEVQQQTGDIERVSVDGIDYDILREKLRAFADNGVTKILWSNDSAPLSNMNDFTTAGVYELSGEHKRNDDNLPIANTGGGHTFNARLTVLDSSIERTEGEPQSDDKCITQLLNFNNRLGQAEIYIRTGKGRTLDSLSWDNWSTLQRNVNVGQVNKLDDFIDNGIYSGIYTDDYTFQAPTFIDTFTLIVINNYAVASKDSRLKRTISQLKYAVDAITNQASVKQRTKTDGDDKWSDWTDIGGGYTLPVATNTVLGGVKVYETKGKVSSGPSGAEYSVNIRHSGILYTTVDHADETHEGVVYLTNSVEDSNKAVTAKAVKDALENISQGGGSADANSALRPLFLAEEAVYNDSSSDIEKTTPWGDSYIHKAKCYSLNGVGDITETEMTAIYNAGKIIRNNYYNYKKLKIKTTLNVPFTGGESNGIDMGGVCSGSAVQILCFIPYSTYGHIFYPSNMSTAFSGCTKLKKIVPIFKLNFANNDNYYRNTFLNCTSLEDVKLEGLKNSISFAQSSLISKESVLFLINKATPTAAITITLHADAYARLANDADIVSALEAQPLVTLVSA